MFVAMLSCNVKPSFIYCERLLRWLATSDQKVSVSNHAQVVELQVIEVHFSSVEYRTVNIVIMRFWEGYLNETQNPVCLPASATRFC